MSEPLPVVLIPGLLLDWRLYTPQLPALWPHGVVLACHTGADTMAAIARRILATAPPRFALAGLSMGGYLAFEILRQAPERVARVAFLDTTAQPDSPEVSAGRRSQMQLAAAGGLVQVVAGLIPRLVHPRHRGNAALTGLIRDMGREVGVQGYLNQQAAIIGRPDSRPMLGRIRCPALVVVGDGDVLTPPDRAAEIANGIPGAQLVVVPGCGHLSTLECPEAVTSALRTWLSR
ncbi:MAG: alpha/beta fold hydrolase [Proteobacteria bacterium]|nr:alpha/beta fold hydrolase [Pseudomonadota bacterium]